MTRSDDAVPPAVAAVGKMLDFFVFAPLGAGVKLVEDGPAAVTRARQELNNARFIGRMVVNQGAAQLRERLAEQRAGSASTDAPIATPTPESAIASTPAASEPDDQDVIADDTVVAPGATDELALPDYDHLPAIDIVAQLESLHDDELDEIEVYERANRRRRTVLGKIAQLRSDR